MERGSSVKFLWIHIAENLVLTINTPAVSKKAPRSAFTHLQAEKTGPPHISSHHRKIIKNVVSKAVEQKREEAQRDGSKSL